MRKTDTARKPERAKLHPAVGVAAALLAGGLAIAYSIHSSPTSPSSDSTTSAADSARSEGAAYASELRAAGYNSFSINVSCEANDGHYQGDNFQDYQVGCAGIAMQVTQQGN